MNLFPTHNVCACSILIGGSEPLVSGLLVKKVMKLIRTTTRRGTVEYDCLYDATTFLRIAPRFEDIDLNYEDVWIDPCSFPNEITQKILLKTIIGLLKLFRFPEAMDLICIDRSMVHHVYFAIFGTYKRFYGHDNKTCDMIRRLSRSFRLIYNLYDFYLTAPCSLPWPAVVLEYECHFMLSSPSVIAPWDFAREISVISVEHRDKTEVLHLGELYGDMALLLNETERQGILHCGLAFPMINFILMDTFQFLSVFQNTQSCYYFSRFSLLMRAIFGPHFCAFYMSQFHPYHSPEHEDVLTLLFENAYTFQLIPYCVRQ